MLYRRLLPVLLALPAAAAALDVQAGSKPEYLAMNYRAEWRMKLLSEVLEEIQKSIEKPVVATASVINLGDKRLVALVDERKAPLREVLEQLEAVQDLRFTAEPLRLRVESTADAQARRRRPVDLQLSEYALFSPIRDFPADELGFGRRMSGGDGKGYLFGGEGGGQIVEAENVVSWLKDLAEAGTMQISGRTALHVQATPEEEAALRKALGELLSVSVRQTAWRITWGLAPAAGDLPTGIVPAADAARAAAALAQPTVANVHALAGQRVHGGRLRQQSYASTAEVVSSRLDPVSEVLTTGRSADLRPLPGATLTLLEYRLDWVDPLAIAAVPISEGPAAGDPPAKPGEQPPPAPPGEQLTLQLPSLWAWQPVGEVVLPHGHSLVLCAEHPQGRAVVVVEEVR